MARSRAPYRHAASFAKLWAVQIIAHSPFTLSMPRRRNWRKLLACLICPKTGSTMYFRIRYRLLCPPCRSLARMACTSLPPFATAGLAGTASRDVAAHRARVETFEIGL